MRSECEPLSAARFKHSGEATGLAKHSRNLVRYNLFGWDYAAINPLSEQEVESYLRWADMASFELDKRFALAVIPDNSFRELPTRRLLRQCLRTIRRHLMPGGELLITERRFRPEMYPDGVRWFGWSEARRHPKTGDLVRRRGHVRLHKGHRRLSGEFEYEVTNRNGKTRTVCCRLSAAVLSLEDYLSLFGRVGFETKVFFDYEMAPGAGDGSLWCFVCSPGGALRD